MINIEVLNSSGHQLVTLGVQRLISDCSSWNVGGLYVSIQAPDDAVEVAVAAFGIFVAGTDADENVETEGYNKALHTNSYNDHTDLLINAFVRIFDAEIKREDVPSWRERDYNWYRMEWRKDIETHDYSIVREESTSKYTVKVDGRTVYIADALEDMYEDAECARNEGGW